MTPRAPSDPEAKEQQSQSQSQQQSQQSQSQQQNTNNTNYTNDNDDTQIVSSSTTSTNANSPEFVAVILAASCGARLYPLTFDGKDDDDDNYNDDYDDDYDDMIPNENEDEGNNENEKDDENMNDFELVNHDNDNCNDDDKDGSFMVLNEKLQNMNVKNDSKITSSTNITTTGTGTTNAMADTASIVVDKDNSGNDDKMIPCQSSSMSQKYSPKHLLPVAGVPILHRLLWHLHHVGFEMCIVAVSRDDKGVTLQSLCQDTFGATMSNDSPIHHHNHNVLIHYKGMQVHVVVLPEDCAGSAEALRYLSSDTINSNTHTNTSPTSTSTTTTTTTTNSQNCDTNTNINNNITFSQETSTTNNPFSISIIPPNSSVILMPADLVIHNYHEQEAEPSNSSNYYNYNNNNNKHIATTLGLLADAHRNGCYTHHDLVGHNKRHNYNQYHTTSATSTPHLLTSSTPIAGLTMLLTDVGEEDENGVPLKESAKAKKGGVARDEDEMEYIALSSPSPSTFTNHSLSTPQTVQLKLTKYSVEEDEENTGSTPKLIIPKAKLHSHHLKNANYHTPHNNTYTSSHHHSNMTIRTDLSDVHVYVLAPWILKLLHARPFLKDVQKELLPLLISRQAKGIKRAFGIKKQPKQHHDHDIMNNNRNNNNGHNNIDPTTTTTTTTTTNPEKTNAQIRRDALLEQVLQSQPLRTHTKYILSNDMSSGRNSNAITTSTSSLPPTTKKIGLNNSMHPTDAREDDNTLLAATHDSDIPFQVTAQVLPRYSSKVTMRACTIPSYLYCCREVASLAATSSSSSSSNPVSNATRGETQKNDASIPLPEGTNVNAKFKSLIMKDTSLGDKVQIKSSTIGKSTKIGNRCRLNNVVVMEHVTIGDNSILQNSILGVGSKVGSNCNLNDCQVGPGAEVPSGTKGKGESFERI